MSSAPREYDMDDMNAVEDYDYRQAAYRQSAHNYYCVIAVGLFNAIKAVIDYDNADWLDTPEGRAAALLLCPVEVICHENETTLVALTRTGYLVRYRYDYEYSPGNRDEPPDVYENVAYQVVGDTAWESVL